MKHAAPRILILTASVGAGHIRAAEAVELALKELAPDAHVKNVDLMTCATPIFRRMYSKWYLDLVSKAPHLLGYFYDLTDRAPTNSRRDRFRLMVERANLTKLDPILHDPQGWDIVVNTHFLPAEIIARLRRKKKWPNRSQLGARHSALSTAPVPQYTVVTDFDAHGLWANWGGDPTDRYFVATEEAAISLGRWGVPREIVTITGIPIHPVFAAAKDPREMRRAHNLPPDRPVILLLAGGFGVGPIEHLFEAALRVEHPGGIHLIVVCGKNEALKKKLEQRARSLTAASRPRHSAAGTRHSTSILGFTRQMDELMAAADIVVSKPGGLTTSEILARGAAMAIVNPIPGQESRNSDYLLENGAAIKINSAAVLAYKLSALLESPARLRSLRENARSLGHPRAAFDVAQAVLAATAL
jgi:processive 1,2-diacylglycerol beta-glucosyltransferase